MHGHQEADCLTSNGSCIATCFDLEDECFLAKAPVDPDVCVLVAGVPPPEAEVGVLVAGSAEGVLLDDFLGEVPTDKEVGVLLAAPLVEAVVGVFLAGELDSVGMLPCKLQEGAGPGWGCPLKALWATQVEG